MNLIRQLTDHSAVCIEYARRVYADKAHKGERDFNHVDYVPLLERFIDYFDQVVIMCDALDESLEGYRIAETLSRLHLSDPSTSPSIKIMFTSRFDLQLERRYTTLTSNRVALGDNMQPDIARYVDVEVDARVTDGTLKLRDKSLRTTIQQQIASRAGT
jgi:hypothetical protein